MQNRLLTKHFDVQTSLESNYQIEKESYHSRCTVYITGTAIDVLEISNNIFTHFMGYDRTFSTFETHTMGLITVELNTDFDEQKAQNCLNGFLFYPVILDIDPSKQIDHSRFVYHLLQLLTYLKQKHYKIVVSCDYEEELPNCGGYSQVEGWDTTR